jgi:ABC-type transport system involved in cytochrome bd biosynthesis fused ATPase/permease subunit
MSFGGSVSGMLTSLKDNARSKRENFFKKNKDYIKKNNGLKKLVDRKPSQKQLNKIKNQLESDKKKENIRTLIIISTIVVLFVLTYLISQWIWMKNTLEK